MHIGRLRIAIAVAAAVAAAFALSACGGRSPSAEQTRAAGSPTPVVLPPVAQGLTFAGYLSGALSVGTGDCRVSASRSIYQVTVAGELAGARHSIRVVAESYNGPGTYGGDTSRRATVRLDSGPGVAGTLVVNDDGASGSMDVDLTDDLHVSGTWSCTVTPE